MGYNGPVEKLRKPAPTREMQNSTYSKFLKFLFVCQCCLIDCEWDRDRMEWAK